MQNIHRLVSNPTRPQILISALTIVEVTSKLMEDYRVGKLRKGKLASILEHMRKDINRSSVRTTRPFTAIPVPEVTYPMAEHILVQHANRYGIGSNDALHLALVEHLRRASPNVTLVTSDHAMQNVCARIGVPIFDPEQDG